jgi:arylsulfatase A-like enzyme
MTERPNFLFITSDQQHWFTLGISNPRIKTPNLDRLAAMGTNFTRAYCPNPTCTPTRATLITGQYPSQHGAFTLGTKLPENVPTLGESLHDQGYWTALIGKAHFQPLINRPDLDCKSIESYPLLRDLEYWKKFNDEKTPWYGFDYVETCRNHADEGHAGQHYGIWLEEQGLTDWKEYFGPRQDGVKDAAWSKSPTQNNTTHWELPEELHYTAWTGKRTIAAIEKAKVDGNPFFIWSSYHDPHPPYAVSEPWASMYNPDDMEPGVFVEGEFEKMPPPHKMTRQQRPDFDAFNTDHLGNHGYQSHLHDCKWMKKMMACYYGMISFMDHWIGKTLNVLEANGMIDNTLIVFTSDHGHFLGQHGLIAKGPFHYDDVIRVPMIAAWKNKIPAGKVNEDVQSLVDFAPTFCAAAGMEVPRSMSGKNVLTNWTDGKMIRDYAIVENHHQSGPEVHLRTLVHKGYKLTIYRGRGWGELFDMYKDPTELNNVYNDPAYQEIKNMMYHKFIDAALDSEMVPTARVFCA